MGESGLVGGRLTTARNLLEHDLAVPAPVGYPVVKPKILGEVKYLIMTTPVGYISRAKHIVQRK